MSQKLAVGLTGVIGAGKSTVLRLLQMKGAAVQQSDEIAKALLREDVGIREALRERWGEAPFAGEGGLDRAWIARRVFGQTEERAWLEGLLHPQVRKAWQQFLQTTESPIAIVEIPLLFEKNLAEYFDLSVAILARNDTTEPRLRARGMQPAAIAARRQAQLPASEKAARANIVLTNDGSPEHLSTQVNWLWQRLVEWHA